jgi:hypothetical protein
LHTSKSEQAEADEIKIQRLLLQFRPLVAEVFRVLHHEPTKEECQCAHRQVDVKDPAPGILVGDVTSEGRADHRSKQCGDAKKGLGGALLLRGETIQQDALAGGLEAAAGQTLHHAEEDQLAETRRHPAEQGVDGKDGD